MPGPSGGFGATSGQHSDDRVLFHRSFILNGPEKVELTAGNQAILTANRPSFTASHPL
jgi:hypothetical protein